MTIDSDDMLAARSRNGDEEAFRMLYRRYEVRLMRYLLQLSRNRQTAEDIFQETVLEIIRAKKIHSESGSIARWLFVVAKNKHLNRIRSERRYQSSALTEDTASESPDAESQLAARENLHALDRAVRKLPSGQKELYALRLSGMALEDIAAVLAVPTGTVKSRLNRLIQKIKEDLI